MAQPQNSVNMAGKAPLHNVTLCLAAYGKAVSRPLHLPGITVFYGPSGIGKSAAAAVTVTKKGAYYVQAQSSWTRKAFYSSVLKVMGIVPAKTLYEMSEQVATQLAVPGKGLIVDDAQYMAEKGTIEAIKDIFESSNAPIMLIGEENLPGQLKRWERIHGRVLEFTQAQPASLDDASELRAMYAKKVAIADDLLALVHAASNGSVRRICVNLERIQDKALAEGRTAMDAATWGERELYTGEAPARRVTA